jgi:hypothetical protein
VRKIQPAFTSQEKLATDRRHAIVEIDLCAGALAASAAMSGGPPPIIAMFICIPVNVDETSETGVKCVTRANNLFGTS